LYEDWHLHELAETSSTSLEAEKLGAWEAVRADRQTAGRGRFQRGWVSDEGGLWLSAVVPTGPDAAAWRALPLAVCLAVCDALQSIGLRGWRVRWPNDVLVSDRKLAGLLVEQFAPGLAAAGIGINVFNHPERHDPGLKNQVARLADLIAAPPDLRELTRIVLGDLRRVVEEMRREGFGSLLPRINQMWGRPRRVELDLNGDVRVGTFVGVGEEGELLLMSDSGRKTPYEASQVRHLKEIDL
jgi:BirA family biotin operon repressor/biotin-[acetyl-CoA-carboxylase] ligase